MFEVNVVFETEQCTTLKLLVSSHDYQFTHELGILTVTAETKNLKQAKDKLCHILTLGDAVEATTLKQSIKKTIYDTELGIEFPTRTQSKEVPSEG